MLFHTGLENTVLLLPRLVPRLRDASLVGTLEEDPLSWGVPQVIQQVQALIDQSGLTTLPSLEEWATLSDKV